MLVNNTRTTRALRAYHGVTDIADRLDAAKPGSVIVAHVRPSALESKRNLYGQTEPNSLSLRLMSYRALDFAKEHDNGSLEVNFAEKTASARRALNFKGALEDVMQRYEIHRSRESFREFTSVDRRGRKSIITGPPSPEYTTTEHRAETMDFFRTVVMYAAKLKKNDTDGVYSTSFNKAMEVIGDRWQHYVTTNRLTSEDSDTMKDLQILGFIPLDK